MRRSIAIGAGIAVAGIAVLGTVYGPQLWNAYRFMDTLDRMAAAYEADAGPWPQLQDSCALCHGRRGRSSNAHYPSLAGLPASYIESQMRAFADGRRRNPQMSPLAAALSDEQIKKLAAYYARRTPKDDEPVDARGGPG